MIGMGDTKDEEAERGGGGRMWDMSCWLMRSCWLGGGCRYIHTRSREDQIKELKRIVCGRSSVVRKEDKKGWRLGDR